MKFFGKLSTIISIVALGVVGAVAQSEVVTEVAIRSVTGNTADAQFAASQASSDNIQAQYKSIIAGLDNIAFTANSFVTEFPVPNSTFSPAKSEELLDSLIGLVAVQKQLITTLIDKHNIVKEYDIRAVGGIAAGAEGVYDSLVNFIPAIVERLDASKHPSALKATRPLAEEYVGLRGTYSE